MKYSRTRAMTALIIACSFLCTRCEPPTNQEPLPSLEITRTKSPTSQSQLPTLDVFQVEIGTPPGQSGTSTASPSPVPTQLPSPTPQPLPNRSELKQQYEADIQPLLAKLGAANTDAAASITDADQIIYIPQTERLYAVQSILGLTRPVSSDANQRVYVLYEILRGADLTWKPQEGIIWEPPQGFTTISSAITQVVVVTLRLVVESAGTFSLLEREDSAGGVGSTSLEELIYKAVPPLQKLPASLQSAVESDLELVIAYACGIDLRPDLDLTRRATALSLALESSEWADKNQGLDSLNELPSLPISLNSTLLAHVSDPDYSFRVRQLLAKIGAEEGIFSQALQDLNSTDPQVRLRAAMLLGETPGDPNIAVPALVNSLADPHYNVVSMAQGALVKIGKPAVESLIETLQNGDPQVQQLAAGALGRIGDARAVEPLINAMQSGDRELCMDAAEALGQIGSPAVEALIPLLQNNDFEVRKETANALGNARDTRAVDPLISALQDNDPSVRWYAARALGNLRNPRALLPLIALLQDDTPAVRETVIEALVIFEDARAVAPLVSALDDREWDIRFQASQALVKFGPSSVEALISALKNQSANVRYWASRALADIDDARSLEPLLSALKAGDLEIVAGAYRTFIEIGETGSEALLVKALEIHSTQKMAVDFLNCGNSVLEQAARDWAEANGYTAMTRSPGGDIPIWGSRQ